MAFELGITKSAYSKIERGETNPSVNRLFDIAKILEVDITEFFHNTDAEHLAGEEEENLYNPTIREEIEALNKALLTMNQRHTQEINNLSTAFLSLLKRLPPEENQ
jgi:transcriptional regulator with XRE-family HTH domain